MCNCRTFSGDDDRQALIREIKSFSEAEVIYACTPFGLWSKVPDPTKQVVRSQEHADFDRLSKIKTRSNMHWKYLIGKFEDGYKMIYGSGNFTYQSIFNEDDWYEVVHRECHKERFDEHFSNWQKSWEKAQPHTDEGDSLSA